MSLIQFSMTVSFSCYSQLHNNLTRKKEQWRSLLIEIRFLFFFHKQTNKVCISQKYITVLKGNSWFGDRKLSTTLIRINDIILDLEHIHSYISMIDRTYYYRMVLHYDVISPTILNKPHHQGSPRYPSPHHPLWWTSSNSEHCVVSRHLSRCPPLFLHVTLLRESSSACFLRFSARPFARGRSSMTTKWMIK